MTSDKKLIIVGAGAAGVTLATNLCRLGFDGAITLVGEETADPYDRPPLSKGFLVGMQSEDDLRLSGWDELEALGVSTVRGRTAQALDVDGRIVTLDDAEKLGYDDLVIATGVRARTLPSAEHLAGCITLRTIDDARRLQSRLLPKSRVVIIGAGFIGLEVVSSLLGLGCAVTVVEPQPAALVGRLPPAVSGWLTQTHIERGAVFHFATGVTDIHVDVADVLMVETTRGETLLADTILVGIGTIPRTDWLESSGLVLQDGVRCNEYSQAFAGVHAIGDVSSPLHPVLGRNLRFEHRSNASEQALALAQTLTGERRAYSPLPFFWTDQLGFKIQMFGVASPDAEFRVVSGAIGEHSFIGTFVGSTGIEAVLASNARPKELLPFRRELSRRYSAPT